MRKISGPQSYTAAFLGAALCLAALAAAAQTPAGSPEVCRNVNENPACRQASRSTGAVGTHPYERWDDGSLAVAGTSNAPPAQTPKKLPFRTYIGGYNFGYSYGH